MAEQIDDQVVSAAPIRERGFTAFRWEVTQFTVSHLNIVDVTNRGNKGERTINESPIARAGENDGSVQSYEFVAQQRDIRGGKLFEIGLVRTDGTVIRTPVPGA